MKIKTIRSIPLAGTKVDSGWETRLDKEENLHTLIEVKTDEGVSGIGSVYTSQALVDGALRLLNPILIGETALEPERVSEKLHQMTFWNGRGGAVDACHQRHRYRPVGHPRQGHRAAGGAPAGRLLPPDDQALRVDPVR